MPENKPTILQRVIQRFGGSLIKSTVDRQVKEAMAKAGAADIVRFSPRQMVMPGGSTRKPYPLGVAFQTLRDFADYYPIARAAVEYRKAQITQLDWNAIPVDATPENYKNKKNLEDAKKIKEFFKYPTGKKDSSFTLWIKQILEDLLVIDAVAIYRRRNRRGDIIGYLPIDAATIELILDQDGTTPEFPADAYIQKIQGMEKARLTTDDLIYSMMSPRTHNAYGFAALETLIITVRTALKLQAYSLGQLTEGNVPEGFVTLPRDIASSKDQLKEWQEAWGALISGGPRMQRELEFLPEGMKYEPTIQASDMIFERFEKWLAISTCSVFGVPPMAIGLTFETNRSTAQVAWEAGKERGLFPPALFIKELMDRMVQEDLNYKFRAFNRGNLNPTNKREEADVVKILVNSGLLAIDEWRMGENLPPTGASDPLIMTPVGPIFVKDLAAQSDAGQMPILPYKPPAEANATSQNAGNAALIPNVPPQAQTAPSPKKPITSSAKKIDDDGESIEELKRWKRAAINDFKDGKSPRIFKTIILDNRTCGLISEGLSKIKDRQDIDKVFEPFLDSRPKVVSSLLSLYDEIAQITAREPGAPIAAANTSG